MDIKVLRSFEVTKTADQKLKDPNKLKFLPSKFKVSGDGVFYTLQGEGPTMGMPSIFVRLHICNLQCVWCDSWYTWNKNTPEFWTESTDMSIPELEQKILSTWGCKNKNVPIRVIFTGGEPMLQQSLITEFASYHKDWNFEIETNGTITPNEYMLQYFRINCSPKLENSKNPKVLRFNELALIQINDIQDSCFKFVVMSANDLQEIEDDFVKTEIISIDKIILMPQGVTQEEVWKNARAVAETAKEKGYRMMGRMQTDVWGTKRRV